MKFVGPLTSDIAGFYCTDIWTCMDKNNLGVCSTGESANVRTDGQTQSLSKSQTHWSISSVISVCCIPDRSSFGSVDAADLRI